ncbi:MAG: YdhR family protein [SAR324 cluster bacterium]|nr:YdhR family protein [SAR324 cluster bacterium]
MISKRWLANEETNTYCGIYFWETKKHMQDWIDSQIFKDIGSNPASANANVKDFEMIESLSAVTRGV